MLFVRLIKYFDPPFIKCNFLIKSNTVEAHKTKIK